MTAKLNAKPTMFMSFDLEFHVGLGSHKSSSRTSDLAYTLAQAIHTSKRS